MRFAGSPQVASFLNSKLDFGNLGKTGQKTQAEQRISATMADAGVAKAGIEGDAMIEAAEHGADARRAQGEAAGQSAMWGGIGKGISGIAGGLGGMFGGTNSNGQTGIDRNFSGLNQSSNFGSFMNNDSILSSGSYNFTPSYNIWNR